MMNGKGENIETSVAAKTILLVDDHQSFLATLVDELRNCSNNFCFLTAENGHIALKALESGGVDLVVTDLKMPVMNGFELISHMKKRDLSTPVIAMSSFLFPEIETKLRDLGVSQYIEKSSLTVEALEEMILKNWNTGTLEPWDTGKNKDQR